MLSPYNKNTHSNHIPGKKFKMVTQKKPSAKFSPPGKRHEVSSVCIANKSTQTKQGRWTKHERLAFLRGLRKFGKSRWKEISTLIPTRYVVRRSSIAGCSYCTVSNLCRSNQLGNVHLTVPVFRCTHLFLLYSDTIQVKTHAQTVLKLLAGKLPYCGPLSKKLLYKLYPTHYVLCRRKKNFHRVGHPREATCHR